MEEFAPALFGIAFFASVVLSLFFYFKARNRERMALIEKGFDISTFYSKRKRNGNRVTILKLGIFFIGTSVGLLVGYMVASFTIVDDVVAYFSMILLFGGISLLLYYSISQRNAPKN